MRRPMYLIAMLGVSLGVVASMSPQAFAATAGWMVNGSTLTGTAAGATTAAVDEIFVLQVSQVEITCQGSTLNAVNPIINATTKMGDAGALEFTACSGNGVCPLAASMEEKIKSLPILTDLTLDGILAVKGRILAANSSKILATFEFEGAECSFSGVDDVRGALTILMPTGQDERTLQSLTTTNEEPGSLKIGGSAVVVKGSALTRLASGLPFSFL